MGLTQVSTDGVKNDAITKTKIPANQIEASELADNAVDNAAVASNAAIAGSKVSPDFGSQNVVTTGTLGSGDITISTANDASLFINTTNANGSHLRLQTSGTNKSFIGQASGISGSLGNANDLALRSTEDIVFSTNNNNTPNVKIDSSGSLLIGTTTVAPFGNRQLTVASGGSTTALELRSPTTGTGRVYFTDSTDSGNSGAYRAAVIYEHATDYMKIETGGGTTRLRIDSDGLKFGSDTAAANALDDYEEGDYTAHFNVEGEGNLSMSGRVGKYVKVGKVVTVIGGGTISSIGGQSSGNAIEFSNLPFAAANTSVNSVGYPFIVKLAGMSNSGIGNMNGNEPYQFIGRLNNNATSGRIEALRNGSNQEAQNASLALTTNTQIQYMFTYIAA